MYRVSRVLHQFLSFLQYSDLNVPVTAEFATKFKEREQVKFDGVFSIVYIFVVKI